MYKVIAAGILLVLTGCATIDPNIKYYEPPPQINAESAGTIVGSRVPQTWPLDHQTIYVLGVSGQPVRGGKAAYNEPIILSEGVQRVTIAWNQGSLWGHAIVQLQVTAGDRYVIKHEKIEKYMVRIWLEDSRKNTPIGEGFFVRINTPSSGGVVPVFIPRAR